MCGVSRPYFFISSSGLPLSPNWSLTATISTGVGKFRAKTWQTLSPKPPFIMCSSAVTTQRVFAALRRMASSSGKGIAIGTKEELKNMIKNKETLSMEALGLSGEDIDTLRQLPHVYDIKYDDKNLEIFFSEGKNNLVRVINYLQEKNISFSRVHSVAPTLNDVFLEITGKELRD